MNRRKTISLGRLCVAKTGYVALRPHELRAARRASCGVSTLSLRSGLSAPRQPVAVLPETLTVVSLVSRRAAVTGPRMQHVYPAHAGFFFASLPVLAYALSCRADGAMGARRAAIRFACLYPQPSIPSFPSNLATIGPLRRRSRRTGPCCRCATARTIPELDSLTVAASRLNPSRDDELRGTAAASGAAVSSAEPQTWGLRI